MSMFLFLSYMSFHIPTVLTAMVHYQNYGNVVVEYIHSSAVPSSVRLFVSCMNMHILTVLCCGMQVKI